MLSIILEYKTPIIFTKNPEDTSKVYISTTKREKRELSLNVSRKDLDNKEKMQFILEGFHNIGPKTSKKLLDHFKTLRELFNVSQEELRGIIGKKADVFTLLDEKY